MSIEQNTEPWSYHRLRHRLTMVIEALPSVTGRDRHSTELLKTIAEDLITIRSGLDQWHGDGIFQPKPKSGGTPNV